MIKIAGVSIANILILIVLTSCLPVSRTNDYQLADKESRWISYRYFYNEYQSEHVYFFSDSIRTKAKIKELYNVSRISLEWLEKPYPVYFWYFIIPLPIIPEFLFNMPKDKDISFVRLDMNSNNDSIKMDLKNIKIFANGNSELNPSDKSEYIHFIDKNGSDNSIDMSTINDEIIETGRWNWFDTTITKSDFQKIKNFSSIFKSYCFKLDSDTIKTLTVVFDSVEVNGKNVFIEPLLLKQNSYHLVDMSLFK
jgi:hypothetical protein